MLISSIPCSLLVGESRSPSVAKVSSSVAATPEKKGQELSHRGTHSAAWVFSKERPWSFVEGVVSEISWDWLNIVFFVLLWEGFKSCLLFVSFFNVPRKTRKLPGIQTWLKTKICFGEKKSRFKGWLAETNEISSLHWKCHNCKLNICAKLIWAAIGKLHFFPLDCVILWSLQWHLMIPCIARKFFTFRIHQI